MNFLQACQPTTFINKYTSHMHFQHIKLGSKATTRIKKLKTYKILLLNINLTNYFF
jgi:hypothetical protein